MSAMEELAEEAVETASRVAKPITEHARTIRRDASTLAEDLRGTRRELENALGQELTQRPLRTVGIAMGIGYVLGGGLTSRMTYSLLGTATRLSTMAMLAREMWELSRRWQSETQSQQHGQQPEGGEELSQYSGMSGGGSGMGAGSYQGESPGGGGGEERRHGASGSGREHEFGGGGTPPTRH